jgi:hypothetical protein
MKFERTKVRAPPALITVFQMEVEVEGEWRSNETVLNSAEQDLEGS